VDDLRQCISAFIPLYKEASASESAADIVLFDDAIEHLVRISRLLHMPGGHALLIGDCGLGKRSLAHLASFVAGCRTYDLSLNG